MKPQEPFRMHRQRNIISGSYQDLQVNCHSETIIRDLFNKIKRGELHIRKAPDVTFAGEVGIDAHGLTKEFFYLVMNCQDMVKEDTSYLKANRITLFLSFARSSTKVDTFVTWACKLQWACYMVNELLLVFPVLSQLTWWQMTSLLQVPIYHKYRRCTWLFCSRSIEPGIV